ncbi:MAG TPA: hypothetical protein VJ570_02645 [Holophagaceae bacterium]|nr:hypothetical protein [Holophagaceae bacterium]
MPNSTRSPQRIPAGSALATALLGLALAAGCGGGGGSASTPSAPVGTCPISAVPATPSWSTHIYPFIQQSCGVSSTSCHDNPGTRVNFNQGSAALYTALVNVPTLSGPSGWVYIKPYDDLTAANRRSWLYEKVDPLVAGSPGGGIGSPMPLGSTLCAPTKDTLRAWIIAGAPNP